jgi:GntR family transcriptional regulator
MVNTSHKSRKKDSPVKAQKASLRFAPKLGALASAALSNDNRVPLYHQIFLILRSKIADGEYAVGSYLPGELELEETFGVSRITAVRALNELAAAGLVVRERGRGTRVQMVASGMVARGPAGVAGTAEDSVHPAGGVVEDLSAAKIKVYEFEFAPAPPAVAAALALPEGTVVQYATRVANFAGKPFNHLTTYVPEDVARKWSRKDLERTPMTVLMERNGPAIHLVRENITATLADMQVAERLQVGVGSPLLKVTRVSYDRHNRAIDYMIGLYPPDRYQYVLTLPRGSDTGLRLKTLA